MTAAFIVKPRYNEGAKTRQNMFGRTRFRISRFFSIYFITEPLYDYLQTAISSRVFHYTANRRFFRAKSLHIRLISRIFLRGNATNQLSATRRRRKRENSERAAHFFVRFFWHHCRTNVVKPSRNSNAIVATSISLEIPIQRLIINGEKISLVKAGTSLCRGSLYRGPTLRIVQQTSRIKSKALRAQLSDKRDNIDTIFVFCILRVVANIRLL